MHMIDNDPEMAQLIKKLEDAAIPGVMVTLTDQEAATLGATIDPMSIEDAEDSALDYYDKDFEIE